MVVHLHEAAPTVLQVVLEQPCHPGQDIAGLREAGPSDEGRQVPVTCGIDIVTRMDHNAIPRDVDRIPVWRTAILQVSEEPLLPSLAPPFLLQNALHDPCATVFDSIICR